MKISQLISYRHILDSINLNQVNNNAMASIQEVLRELNTHNVDFENLKEDINETCNTIDAELRKFESKVNRFKKALQDYIGTVDQSYYAKSERLYMEGRNDRPDYILDRTSRCKLLNHPENLELFVGRLNNYVSWKFPAMQLRPANCQISDYIVGSDPLYLADTNHDLLEPARKHWTSDYQRRLRYYVINESEKEPLKELPDNQLGLVVAIDFFNYKSLNIVQRYLRDIFVKLRPGGVAMLTFNNCDYPNAVDIFEKGFYCYTPGHKIKEYCKELGFEFIASFDLDENISWIEIKKPGEITSIRGGQTLGRILTI